MKTEPKFNFLLLNMQIIFSDVLYGCSTISVIGTNEYSNTYIEDWINNRPMKVLNYMTPNEKFHEMSVAF